LVDLWNFNRESKQMQMGTVLVQEGGWSKKRRFTLVSAPESLMIIYIPLIAPNPLFRYMMIGASRRISTWTMQGQLRLAPSSTMLPLPMLKFNRTLTLMPHISMQKLCRTGYKNTSTSAQSNSHLTNTLQGNVRVFKAFTKSPYQEVTR